MRLSPRHPRYRSLLVRAALADSMRSGLVAPEGLIAHGRGEAFDYFLGERTTRSARSAERTAARWLWAAKRPVVSVNGNVAALAAPEIARLSRILPRMGVEVNLFHRTPARALQLARALQGAGVDRVLGIRPTARIPGLPSDRAWVDRAGIYRADVCLVPLEDGDRTAALRARGQKVISIDLNPLSRTSQTADLPVVDELVRALRHIADDLGDLARREERRPPPRFDAGAARAAAIRAMVRRLSLEAGVHRPYGRARH
ncbi:MAG TPA: phosphopantothenate/pantothenate synthetase [Thermoplasmata archaeon]|nr:phosphopantothenate/pantothenate synthetase [Thermoplasmata archaeon]